jgi:LIVCS family branched-chain amino acid:cation transporter
MKNNDIINVGKSIFGLSFLLGNICLFGYLITKNDDFASYGCMLLLFATPVNLFVIVCLLIYGLFNKSQLNNCCKASAIICINIPVAILYFFIGISILKF